MLIQKDDVKALQHNLIQSHACGIGEPFPEEVSRGMLILRANTMLKGVSGVRPLVVNILEFVNRKFTQLFHNKAHLVRVAI